MNTIDINNKRMSYTDIGEARLYVAAFERWLRRRGLMTKPVSGLEATIKHLHDEMKSGAYRSASGKHFKSLSRKLRGGIAELHNGCVGRHKAILRPVADARRYERLAYFRTLSETTQQALIDFELHATRSNGRRSTKQVIPLSAASRQLGVSEAFALLRKLEMNALERITPEIVADFLGSPDPDDPAYRRRVRIIHNLRPVFRFCVEKGLLPINPLQDAPDGSFDNYSQRDFLTPDSLDKLLDLKTVNIKDPQEVRDRLVTLLYVDTCLRRNELASLFRQDVRETSPGIYAIMIAPQQQKMYGKASALIPVLYPSSNQLLDLYLKKSRQKLCAGTAGTDTLIMNANGVAASPVACTGAVKRECERLGLKTYYKEKTPSPHDLRRTFGTLNVGSLGLGLDLLALARRLRDSVEVTHRHYVVANPLTTAAEADSIRRKLSGSRAQDVEVHLAALKSAGVDRQLLKAIKDDVKKQEEEARQVEADSEAYSWLPEQRALDLLAEDWEMLPKSRALLDYCKRRSGVRRSGRYGYREYREDIIRELADDYRPVNALIDVDSWKGQVRTLQRMVSSYSILQIGHVRLLKTGDAVRLLRELNRHRS